MTKKECKIKNFEFDIFESTIFLYLFFMRQYLTSCHMFLFSREMDIRAEYSRECMLATSKAEHGEIILASIPNFFFQSVLLSNSAVKIRLFHPIRSFFSFVISRASRLAARTIHRGCRRLFAGTVPPHCC